MQESAQESGPERVKSATEGVGDQRIRAELALCDAIEAAADDLPALAPRRAQRLSRALRALARTADIAPINRRLDEIEVAPERRARLADALALLAREERADADLAVELADALDAAAEQPFEDDDDADNEARRAAALGYLMRCFFAGRRRHLDWRRHALVAPLCDLLEPHAVRRLVAPQAGPLDLRILYEVTTPEVAAE